MFAKTIIDSDAFLDMPLSAQALYFHLSMRADDDGFINNPKKIQRMIGASDDDCKLLIMKQFIIPFESGIVVIKHWRIHNYIRSDRKKNTNYIEEMASLTEKENGEYSLISETPLLEEKTTGETKRQKAYRESSLPYSFEYKIKREFWGHECPICGAKMQQNNDNGIITRNRIPSIQHNIPISKGGKHELGNISVICKECNVTLQDTETGKLNADEVIEKWDEICAADKRLTNVSQVSDKCQRSIDKDRLDKDSLELGKNSKDCEPQAATTPTRHKYGEYKNVLLSDEDMEKLKSEFPDDYNTRIERLSEYIASTGKVYKNHLATIRCWARKEKDKPQIAVKGKNTNSDNITDFDRQFGIVL